MTPESRLALEQLKKDYALGINRHAFGERTDDMFPKKVVDMVNESKSCPFCHPYHVLGKRVCLGLITATGPSGQSRCCTREKGHEGPCVPCYANGRRPTDHNLEFADWPKEYDDYIHPPLPEATAQPLEI